MKGAQPLNQPKTDPHLYITFILPDLVEGEGFEPSKAEPSDLQSDPFDRSGTPPNETADYEYIALISQSSFIGELQYLSMSGEFLDQQAYRIYL